MNGHHDARGDDGRYRPLSPEEQHSIDLAQLLTGRRPERRHEEDAEELLAAVRSDRQEADRRLQSAQAAIAAHEAAARERALDAEAELVLGL